MRGFMLFLLLLAFVFYLGTVKEENGRSVLLNMVSKIEANEKAKAEEVKPKVPAGIDVYDEEYWEILYRNDISDQTEFVCAHGVPYIFFRGQLLQLPAKKNVVVDAWDVCKTVAKEKAKD